MVTPTNSQGSHATLELRLIIERWPYLNKAVRAKILSLVEEAIIPD
jgi:hypothetical protein